MNQRAGYAQSCREQANQILMDAQCESNPEVAFDLRLEASELFDLAAQALSTLGADSTLY